MITKITRVCEKDGHSFVESSLGKGPEPSKVVYIFCQSCGEVKPIKADDTQ